MEEDTGISKETRDREEKENADALTPITHLALVAHGSGHGRYMDFVQDVNSMREEIHWFMNTKVKDIWPEEANSARIEVLPLQWRALIPKDTDRLVCRNCSKPTAHLFTTEVLFVTTAG